MKTDESGVAPAKKHVSYKLLSELTGKPVAWACEQCGCVVANNEDDARAHELIEVCTECDGAVRNYVKGTCYRARCTACQHKEWARRDAERDAERFEKATKIPMAEWKGECLTDGDDGFWWCLEDALDHYDSHELPRPQYLYDCDPETMTIHAADVIEAATQDLHESAADGISRTAEAKLQAFLDEWCKEVNIVTWTQSARIVLLEPHPDAATPEQNIPENIPATEVAP